MSLRLYWENIKGYLSATTGKVSTIIKNKNSYRLKTPLNSGYGSRYKSMGQALATSFGLWSDFASVETPNDTAIIVPEGMFHKMARGLSKILCNLIVAVGSRLGNTDGKGSPSVCH